MRITRRLFADDFVADEELRIVRCRPIPFQLDELKEALKAAGYLQRFDRKLTCTFPPPSDQTPR